jgi:hypothetical protein
MTFRGLMVVVVVVAGSSRFNSCLSWPSTSSAFSTYIPGSVFFRD